MSRARSPLAGRTGLSRVPAVSAPAAPASEDGRLVVLIAERAISCAECARGLAVGDLLHEEAGQPLCLACAVLDGLELLPSGDVALTRRASQYSRRWAVVLQWSPRRRRFERRGTLVEPAARRLAEVACREDAGRRADQRARAAVRREAAEREFVAAFAAAVERLFPDCPAAEARAIADHACAKSSGRVGRTAMAKALAPAAVRLAVIAHVRHCHTDYDGILSRTRDKRGARARIRERVAAVLRRWEGGQRAVPAAPAGHGASRPACDDP